MPLEGSYAIWNNRGGSGKTTLTYHLANKFAVKNPDKTILLIDMCPQTDLSHAFLGDDENGQDFVSQIGTLKKDPMQIGDQKIPKTVSGYLDLYTSHGLPSNVDPRTFLINVSKYNPQLSRNLYLLCGDASIELIARSLEQKRNQPASLSQFGTNAWKSITTSLKQFINKIAERKGIKLVVFIDANPSFSITTEIALAASDKLLIPINDEHLHRNGFEYMFALLYGFSQPSNVYYYYRHFSFYYRANEHDVKLPKIHLILNKSNSTQNQNSSTSNEKEWEFIFEVYKKYPQAFNIRSDSELRSLVEFKEEFVIDLCEQATTNQIVRQAVRSHSPLLPVKHNSNLNNSNNNRFSTPIIKATSSTSTNTSLTLNAPSFARQASPSPTSINRNSSLPDANSNLNSNNNNSNRNGSSFVQNVSNSNLKQLDCLSLTEDLNNNNLSFTYNNNNSLVDQTNAILFDEILDKIVDSLMKGK